MTAAFSTVQSVRALPEKGRQRRCHGTKTRSNFKQPFVRAKRRVRVRWKVFLWLACERLLLTFLMHLYLLCVSFIPLSLSLLLLDGSISLSLSFPVVQCPRSFFTANNCRNEGMCFFGRGASACVSRFGAFFVSVVFGAPPTRFPTPESVLSSILRILLKARAKEATGKRRRRRRLRLTKRKRK